MASSSQPVNQQDKYLHHFKWESSVPERVSIKGSFDQWQSSLELQKKSSGKFSAQIALDYGSKVSYKYVVDGTWRHNPNEPTETDSNGNVNNILEVPQQPSISMNPEAESVETLPNPVQTMSSAALTEESVMETSTGAHLTKTLEPDSLSQSSTPPDMSIAFPSASTDNLPELTQRSKQASHPKRTLSLFGPGTRFGRASHRTQSLATAPGTPTEKASPAGASVSNVVSAMAGVAATAIPAAIFAVTGKDIIRTSNPDSPSGFPSPPADLSPSTADEPSTTSQSLAGGPEEPSQPDTPAPAPATPDKGPHPTIQLVAEPAALPPAPPAALPAAQPATHPAVVKLASSTPEPLATLSVNDAAENPPLQHSKPVVPLATHQPLSSSAAETSSATESASTKPEQLATASTSPPSVIETTAAPSFTVSNPKHNTPEPKTDTTPNFHREGGKLQTPETSPKAESIPRVSFSDDEAAAARANTTAVEAGSHNAQPVPPVNLSPKPTVSGASTPNKPNLDFVGGKSRISEFTRKTSSWRYSVGSIRSRKTSTEHDRRSVSDNSALAQARSPESSGPDYQEGSSPRAKRRSGLFQKIKAVLSPHKKNAYTTNSSNGGEGHSGKRNSLSRTTTINRE